MGDRIIAVDDKDVRGMSAISVSKMLGSRSENEERRLTVLREIFYDQSEGETESKAEVSELGEEYEMRLAPPRPSVDMLVQTLWCEGASAFLYWQA